MRYNLPEFMSSGLHIEDFVLSGTPVEVLRQYQQLPEIASNNLFGELDENIVIVDTEATGLSFNNDELIQIAACRLNKGQITDWYVTFVDPEEQLREEIIYMTGIHDTDLIGAPKPQDALADLVKFVGDSMLVAHNVSFDRTFCTKHSQGYPLLDNIWLDSLDLARVALPRFKSHRLIDLAQAFNTSLGTHRADDDVRSTVEIYRILLAGISQLPMILLKKLVELAEPDEWNTVVAFRKMLEWKKTQLGMGKKIKTEHVSNRAFLQSLRTKRLKYYKEKFKLSTKTTISELIEEGKNYNFSSDQEIEDAFKVNGFIFALMHEPELRSQQLTMAKAVNSSFAKSKCLVVEAPTGVGKSLAYLVPAALAAKKNNISVGISTKSNVLLDQLAYKDLPYLRKCFQKIGQDLSYVELKGFSHYLCLHRLECLLSSGAKIFSLGNVKVHQAPSLAAILSFVYHTAYDDIEYMKINRKIITASSITVSSHECLKQRCPYYGTSCFAVGAREHARNVDIILTNHSLLFSNIASEGKLLPKIEYWVIDEAHSAEAEARSSMSVNLSAENILNIAGRLNSETSKKNPYIKAKEFIQNKQSSSINIAAKCLNLASQYGGLLKQLAYRFKDLHNVDSCNSSGYEFYELWLSEEIRNGEVFQRLKQLAEECFNAGSCFLGAASLIVDILEDFKDAREIQREISYLNLVLNKLQDCMTLIFGNTLDKYVYSAKLFKSDNKHQEVLSCKLINVGTELNMLFYPQVKSCIYTSATLAIGDSFQSYKDSVGLDKGDFSQCKTMQLEHCFNMKKNMRIYIATDLSDPNSPAYMPQLIELLTGVHLALGGSTLSLFTNRKKMEFAFEQVRDNLKKVQLSDYNSEEGALRVVCQKWGMSTKMLRDNFLENKTLSLFALKSFWEGFDAPGETLRGVVIPQLPFSPPNDPLSKERAARENYAWNKYSLPESILSVKQAVGRLIRSNKDRGCVVFADSRLIEKSYGAKFIASLPSSNIKKIPCSDIVEDIKSQGF